MNRPNKRTGADNIRKLILLVISIIALSIIPVVAKADDAAPLYTEEDVIKIAKTLYGECRSDSIPKQEKAAVVWCILNRVDNPKYADSIDGVITKSQFHGYSAGNPVLPELESLTRDVLMRWELEKLGVGSCGRTLPKDYLFFAGSKGRNRFRKEHRGSGYWDWSLPNPYEEPLTGSFGDARYAIRI